MIIAPEGDHDLLDYLQGKDRWEARIRGGELEMKYYQSSYFHKQPDPSCWNNLELIAWFVGEVERITSPVDKAAAVAEMRDMLKHLLPLDVEGMRSLVKEVK